jgi:hypothetical protein
MQTTKNLHVTGQLSWDMKCVRHHSPKNKFSTGTAQCLQNELKYDTPTTNQTFLPQSTAYKGVNYFTYLTNS